jgi:DNA-directed RNA polymerase specialized sigma subunit
MIVNEVHMAHRKEIVRKTDKRIPLDASIDGSDGSRTVADMLAAPESSPDELDEDWRRAVLESARERVLMRTALSDRDRQVYRDYAIEGMDIADVARKYSLSRNHVSQIKTRIERRIVAVGRELLSNSGL